MRGGLRGCASVVGGIIEQLMMEINFAFKRYLALWLEGMFCLIKVLIFYLFKSLDVYKNITRGKTFCT